MTTRGPLDAQTPGSAELSRFSPASPDLLPAPAQQFSDSQRPVFWRNAFQRSASSQLLTALLRPASRGARTTITSTRLAPLDVPVTFPAEIFWLAVWALLLSRYTGETVVRFGTASEDSTPEIGEGAPSCGTLPLTLEIVPKKTFSEWIGVVEATLRETQAAGPVTASELMTWTGIADAYALCETQVLASGEADPAISREDELPAALTLRMGTSELSLEWDPARLDEATVKRVAGHLETLAQAALISPDLACGDLPLLTAAEQDEMVVQWNSTRAPFDDKKPMHQVIDEQAERVPEAVAVWCDEQSLTYGELRDRSDRLARRLVAAGVVAGALVPLCVSRSVEMIVGLVGIMKAGGAYVPLDPNYPADRIAFVLEDLNSPFLVTEKSLAQKLFSDSPATPVMVDDDAATHLEVALPRVEANSPAYVIYTSGSTGKPKGVVISHRNLAASTAARVAYYGPGHSNYLLLSSYAFDSSVAGIFWMLSTGGTLTLVPEEAQQDLTRIDHLVTERGITTLLCLPSLYALLLERWRGAVAPATLRAVIVAGEACLPTLVARHHEQLSAVVLYNEYGPTEGTVWCTVHRCENARVMTSVPIGKAIPNAAVYLLDAQRQPVPIGVAGEICVGGDGVAQGYLNQPDLTASRFVADPFRLGARMYLTGDFGRYLSDGAIEFLGRRDQQVKVRGFRVELGEIEAVLAQAEGVSECVVVVREDQPGDQRLVAYVTLRSGANFSVSALRHFVRLRLPEYMVPMAVVRLDDFARTATGKVDRKVLPVPDAAAAPSSAPFLAPGSALEQQIAAIWRQDLNLSSVGVEDNFFDIGGHSLSLVRVHQQLQKVLGRDVPITELFQFPTIRTLAQRLGDHSGDSALAEKIQTRAQQQRAALARQRRPAPTLSR